MTQEELKKRIDDMTADSRLQLDIHTLVKEVTAPTKKNLRILISALERGQIDRGRLIESLENMMEYML